MCVVVKVEDGVTDVVGIVLVGFIVKVEDGVVGIVLVGVFVKIEDCVDCVGLCDGLVVVLVSVVQYVQQLIFA